MQMAWYIFVKGNKTDFCKIKSTIRKINMGLIKETADEKLDELFLATSDSFTLLGSDTGSAAADNFVNPAHQMQCMFLNIFIVDKS